MAKSNSPGTPGPRTRMRRSRLIPAPLSVLFSMLLSLPLGALWACGGSGTYEAGVYSDGEARYAIGQPGSGWQRLDVAGDNDLAFNHEGLAAIIQANATCDPGMDVPLSALRNHLLIGWTEREVEDEHLLTLDSREALQTHLVAKLDGVPRELVLTVAKKDGCVYDFALVAPPGAAFAQARESYDAVVRGFRAE